MNQALLLSSETWVITFFASFLIWLMFAALLFIWFFQGKFEKRHVLNALFASFIAWLASEAIKHAFPTLRPFQVEGTMPLTLMVPLDPAFPSGHTSAAFALATSITKYNKKIGYFYLGLASLVGVSRVLGRVHYFADILGGALIGVISVTVLNSLNKVRLLNLRKSHT